MRLSSDNYCKEGRIRQLEDNEMMGVFYVAFTHVDPLLGAKIKLEKTDSNGYNFQLLKWS